MKSKLVQEEDATSNHINLFLLNLWVTLRVYIHNFGGTLMHYARRLAEKVQRKPSFLSYNKYQPREAVFSEADTGIFRQLKEAPLGGTTGVELNSRAQPLPLPWYPQYTSASGFEYTSCTTERSGYVDERGGKSLSATPMGSTTKLVGDKNPDEKVPWFKFVPGLGTTLLTLSLTASFGNLLRLPRLVYQYDGGSFLFAYAIVTIFLGLPLAFLEIVLGQFCQQGTTKLWRAVPLLRGVGFVKVMVSQILAVYYPALMAISLFYAAWSAKGPLPFHECANKLSSKPFISSTKFPKIANGEACLQNTFIKPLDQNAMWFGVNVALLFLIWTVLLLCVFKNAQSYRKSMYFIMIPIIVFFVAIVWEQIKRGPYSFSSLLFINWKALLSFDIWYYAVIQFFFSTHIGFGSITTGAGVLFSKSSAFWTAVFYIFMNLFVGVLFVFNVYSWIENLETAGYSVIAPKITETFVLTIIYDAISRTYDNLEQVWATISFLLLVLAGFASSVSIVFTVVTAFSVETKNKWKWWIITSGICLISFFASIFCLLKENLTIIHIFDSYVVGRILILSTVLELIGFIYIYGLESLSNDFEFVLGYKLNFLWKIFWLIAPIFLTVLETWSLVISHLLHSKQENGDAPWIHNTGWGFYAAAWLIIIFTAFWQIYSQVDYNLAQKFRSALKPSRNWGPVDPIYRHCWVQWKKQYQITGERDFTLKRRGTRDYTHSVKRSHSRPANSAYSTNTASMKSAHNGPVNSSYSIEPVSIRRPHGKKINSAYSIDPATLKTTRSRSFNYNGDLASYEQTIKPTNHRYTLDSYFPDDNIHDYIKSELEVEKEPPTEFSSYVYTPTQNLSSKYSPTQNYSSNYSPSQNISSKYSPPQKNFDSMMQKKIKTKHSFHEADIDNTTYGRIKIKYNNSQSNNQPEISLRSTEIPRQINDDLPHIKKKHSSRQKEVEPVVPRYAVQPKHSFRYNDPQDDAQMYYIKQNYRNNDLPTNSKVPKSHGNRHNTPYIFQDDENTEHVFWRKDVSPYSQHYM